MKNKLSNLNDHLFEQLERLNDEDLKGERLEVELQRAKGVVTVASQIIANGTLMLDAQKAVIDGMINSKSLPLLLRE